MASRHQHAREYAAQQMFSTYRSGRNVGDAFGDAAAAGGAAAGGADVAAGAISAGVGLLTGLIGLGVQSGQAKKQREHEQELAELNATTAALAAKSAEAGIFAQAQAAAAANKRAITYASAGFASVVVIGSLVYLGMVKRKKK